ncbi:MAG: hypothetical protein R3356_08115, partial [Eudoraea sp.]|nr:hypothetical protein [Eudoraea sp.]
MSKRTLSLCLLIVIFTGLNGQLSKHNKWSFMEADYYCLTEEYPKALSQYENLLEADPDNGNLNFLCGYCCSKIPGSNAEAIAYLEIAVESVDLDYRQGSYKETDAPPAAYLMLGKSY